MSLESMTETLRTTAASLDDATKVAILERVLQPATSTAPAAATAMPPPPARARSWRTPSLLIGGFAFAFAAAAVGFAIVDLDEGTGHGLADRLRPSPHTADKPSIPRPGDLGDLVAADPPPPGSVATPWSMTSSAPLRRFLLPPEFADLQLTGDLDINPYITTCRAPSSCALGRLFIVVKVCVDTRGEVSATPVTSSGIASYDRAIVTAVRAWTFRPYVVDGVAQPVCSILQFGYRQR